MYARDRLPRRGASTCSSPDSWKRSTAASRNATDSIVWPASMRTSPSSASPEAEAARSPAACGERAVRDLPDQGLDEPVLTALGAAWIDLAVEQLAAHEAGESRLQRVGGPPAYRNERGQPEGLTQDGRVCHQAA